MKILAPSDSAERERIAAILDQADFLRRKRREALDHMGYLTQALFTSMFGDSTVNAKQFPVDALGNVTSKISDGPHVSPAYVGIPFVSTRNIRVEGMDWTNMKYISIEDAKRQWKKVKPERGDVLYTKGGTTGIAKAVDFDGDFAVWVHVAVLKLKREVVDPVWLEVCLNSLHCYRQSQVLTKGIANRNLGLKRMIDISFPLPPLNIQREFVSKNALFANVRSAAESQSIALEKLFASLQHRAFRGEL
jgi:type I restriction enzyme, S subunit